MYKLTIEPADNKPVRFGDAVQELYTHAHRRQLSVVLEGIFDGQHRYMLTNPRTGSVEGHARIDLAGPLQPYDAVGGVQ